MESLGKELEELLNQDGKNVSLFIIHLVVVSRALKYVWIKPCVDHYCSCPFAGINFLIPVIGFYCQKCEEFIGDISSAEKHGASHQHSISSTVSSSSIFFGILILLLFVVLLFYLTPVISEKKIFTCLNDYYYHSRVVLIRKVLVSGFPLLAYPKNVNIFRKFESSCVSISNLRLTDCWPQISSHNCSPYASRLLCI